MLKQQATLSKLRSTLSKQHSTLLPQTATMSNDSIVKFRSFDKVECCFDIVAGMDETLGRQLSPLGRLAIDVRYTAGHKMIRPDNQDEFATSLTLCSRLLSVVVILYSASVCDNL